MNEEEKKVAQANVDLKTKETIANQLDSFINPTEKPKNGPNVVSYYSGSEIKTEPLIKISDKPTADEQKQNRPIIRTYKSDVEETVQAGHISSVNIALAENKRMLNRVRQPDTEEKKASMNRNVLIVSVLLILGGALTFFIPQLLIQKQYAEPVVIEETFSSQPLMTVDLEEKLNIKDINLNRVSTTLKERVEQSATRLGQIKNIYLTEGEKTEEKLVTASKFLQLARLNMPPEIQRTLKDQYMFGLHNYNGNQTFLVLKIGSYDAAFAGMLQWETNMWRDFKEMFNLKSDGQISTSSFGLEIKKFQDATFNNKDSRVVKDSSGKIIFLYSIINPNTIVITTSTGTLNEIVNRITRARVITQ